MLNQIFTQTSDLPLQETPILDRTEAIFNNIPSDVLSTGYSPARAQGIAPPFLQPVVDFMPKQSFSARNVLFGMAMSFRSSSIGAMYHVASEKNGSYVIIEQRFGFLPLLWGKDQQPIPVYEVVEEIEAVLDFSELHSRFPSLSYTQISAALGFLRSLAQFNSKGVDIDALQDEEIENSQSFQETVKQAMEDKEALRVLAPL